MQKQTTQHLYQNRMDSASEKHARNVFANWNKPHAVRFQQAKSLFCCWYCPQRCPNSTAKVCMLHEWVQNHLHGQLLLWSLIWEQWSLQCAILVCGCESHSYSWMANLSASTYKKNKMCSKDQLSQQDYLAVYTSWPTSDPVWSHHPFGLHDQNHTLWGNPCTTMEPLNL